MPLLDRWSPMSCGPKWRFHFSGEEGQTLKRINVTDSLSLSANISTEQTIKCGYLTHLI